MSFGKTEGTNSATQGRVWSAQQPFLRSLYGHAQNLFGQQAGIGQASQDLAGGLMSGLGGYQSPTTNPAFQNLLQRAQGGSPYLDQQISGLGADLGQFYRQQLLPGIASQAGLAGQFGGSRQGIAAGMAGQEVARQFAQGATNLRQADYGQGLQAAGMLGGLSNDYLGQMGNIYGMGMNPYMAPWMPLMNFSQIVGAPTVLGSTSSSGGGGFNFGLFS